MFLSILTFITALSISVVAIYYSVAGLVAIFASAAIPVMIMGTTLEIAKLVTAVWLHKYWQQCVWWLKTYLSVAVVLLMLITSMGIFGFLSKAHIDQTATATESIAVIEQIDAQLSSDQQAVARAEQEIAKLENLGSSQDSQIQEQIDREQARIDSAYSRVQPAIDEQNQIIAQEQSVYNDRIAEIQTQISAIDQRVSELDAALAANQVQTAQTIVGTKPDGDLGPGTERAIQAFRDQQQANKQQLSSQIESIRNQPNATIDAARAEIQRLRSVAEKEIASSNELIARLRQQLGTVDQAAQDQQIASQREIIKQAQARIETNTQKKFELESEYRKLEAEVGPIKYLAEFVYGNDAGKDLLEEAVRWVIVLIIFVFDPLAVLLLIASQYSFNIHRSSKKPVSEPVPIVTDIPVTETKVEVTKEPDVPLDNVVEETSVEEQETVDYDLEGRIADLLEKESDEKWKLAKIRWKIDNPRANTKSLRQMYLEGKIDKLPWEEYISTAGYVQNGEQDQSSLFTKIQQTKNE